MRALLLWTAALWVTSGATGLAAADPANGGLSNLTAAQMRDDLVFLRDVWKPQDKSFSSEQTHEFDGVVADAIAHVDQLDPVSFWMRTSRAVALAGNGHTNINGGTPPLPGLPFEAWWFKDGLYIVQAAPDHAELLGARIDKIGTRTAEQALAAVAPFIPGNTDRVRNLSPMYLRVPALLHHLGMAVSDTEAQLTVRLSTGAEREVSLPALQGGDPPLADMENWSVLIPTQMTQAGRWPHVLDGLKERPDIYQKTTDIATRWLGDEHKILYMRSNQIQGLDGQPTSLELKLVGIFVSEIVPNRPKAVILDLRLNSGGNLLNTILFSQALPKVLAPGGKVLVLMSTSTFSAAIATAAMLKESGGASVVFLGTNMGDNQRFYAEGSNVALPNSKLGIHAATGLHDWGAGCRDMERCFWPVTIWGPQTRINLHLDYLVDPTFADYVAGRDPVMDKAQEVIKQRP